MNKTPVEKLIEWNEDNSGQSVNDRIWMVNQMTTQSENFKKFAVEEYEKEHNVKVTGISRFFGVSGPTEILVDIYIDNSCVATKRYPLTFFPPSK